MLVDSHCHIPVVCKDPEGPTAAEVVQRAGAAGVSHMLCVGVDLPSLPGVMQVIEAHPNVFGSVGVHPNTDKDPCPDVNTLVGLADHEKVVAVGETGLDYYYDDVPLDLQHERLRTHIRAAREIGKPLIIHCRDAGADLVRVLREENAQDVGGVMHCFVDTWEVAQATMDLGFYISFSGIVTFKSAESVREVARQVPLDRLLVETDSPWLAPVPFRGKPNEPAYVRYVAEHMATLRELDFDDLAAQTSENFFSLFRHARRTEPQALGRA